ncbi:NRD1 [Cordylochernes scorpioides]|uniref:NRD1 n=1 Tax=Cordylochernes scorpioides TaxID=51811 RepID=A0ABY6KI81_9ARAC|nr:NRD1 [Cordylochernes scorpioides]
MGQCGKLQPALSGATHSAAGQNIRRNSRLFVSDKKTGMRFLVDSGADVSLIPYKGKLGTTLNDFKLYAANGTEISTAKPIDVIAHLMSFEGRGSLLAHFRQKAWAYELEAGNDQTGFERNTIQTIYEISVGLSEEGLEHVCEIITTILAYIKLLTTKDIEPFFHELQRIEYNSFLWYKEDPSTDWVEQLSYNLLNYEPQYCITGNDLYFDYDEKRPHLRRTKEFPLESSNRLLVWQLIKMCLQQLTPDSLNIIIQSSSFPTEELPLQEPYSHASYSCQALDLADFPFLYPPPPNPFLRKFNTTLPWLIPTHWVCAAKDFTIIIPSGEVAKHPVKILEDDFGVVWHKKDMKFLKPKVYICLRLITPILKESAKNSYLLDLLILGMEQELKLDCYHAYITGYNLNLMSASDMGLEFFIDGYHDKISVSSRLCGISYCVIGTDL